MLLNTASFTDYIPLITVLVIIVAVIVAILIIRQKVRSFSKSMFGTDSLTEGINKAKTNLSETPRSLHAMTSVYLPLIKKDFPQFDYELYKNKAQSLLRNYLYSISQKRVLDLGVDSSITLKNNLRGIIEDLNSRDISHTFEEVVIHATEVSRYIKNGATVTVLFEISISCYDYIKNADGKITVGSDTQKKQSVFEVGLVYIQDESKVYHTGESMGIHCPNCGAPITNLGNKTCEYCGSAVVEINTRAWKFDSVNEQTVGKRSF